MKFKSGRNGTWQCSCHSTLEKALSILALERGSFGRQPNTSNPVPTTSHLCNLKRVSYIQFFYMLIYLIERFSQRMLSHRYTKFNEFTGLRHLEGVWQGN